MLHAIRMSRRPATASTGARWRALLVGLTLVAFALRAHRLGAQSLWSDEDITLDRISQPVQAIVAGLPVEHAPLYFLAMRAWTTFAGSTDTALRWPSLACGVLTVPVLAFVAHRLAGRRAAAAIAVAAAGNPFLVWYSQEARMYALVAVLTAAVATAALRARRGGAARWWAATGILAALAVYTHYWAALILLCAMLWAAADLAAGAGARRAAAARGWALAGGAALAAFLPWLPHALGVLSFGGWREPQPRSQAPWVILSAWSAGSTSGPIATRAATWLCLALAGLGVGALGRRALHGPGRHAALLALLYGSLPLAAIVLSMAVGDYHPRYLVAAVPAYLLCAACGAAALPWRGAVAASAALGLAAVPGLWGLYTDPTVQKQDYRAVISTVERAGRPEGTVLLLDGPPFGMMERYRSQGSPVRILNLQRESLRGLNAAELAQAVEDRVASRRDVWLARDGGANGSGLAWLADRAWPVEQRAIQNLTLGRYWLGAGPREADATPAVPRQQPEPLRLAVARGPIDGEVVPVLLVWRVGTDASALADRALRVSVRLLDAAAGAPIAADREPLLGLRPTTDWRPREVLTDRHGLLVPRGTEPPPLETVIEVILYDPATLGAVGHWRWTPAR